MLATKFYWRGCVDTLANRLQNAKQDFLTGLQLLATELTDHPPISKTNSTPEHVQFAHYLTGRLLLGLALMEFHYGALNDARSALSTAMILLSRDSKDTVRLQRARLLLLSVDRLEQEGNKKALEHILAELEEIAGKFDPGLPSPELGHARFHTVTTWTIGLVRIEFSRPMPDEENSTASGSVNRANRRYGKRASYALEEGTGNCRGRTLACQRKSERSTGDGHP